jgi:hypothetical protein
MTTLRRIGSVSNWAQPKAGRTARAVESAFLSTNLGNSQSGNWEAPHLLSHSGTEENVEIEFNAGFLAQLLAQADAGDEVVLLRQLAVQAYAPPRRHMPQQLNATY